ncbi:MULTISPECIES: hypothetical protein [unclassified Mesorhizobium]|uniref:hypothetical protein n=1 Tax=unclassified Mesorhizobium TaxID=325217 RepID=UPI001FED488E|nr:MULTISPECIES: hypothetical protein [unclassified Mesorhizobium]
MNTFHVGMQVVCVDAKVPPHVTIPLGLKEGAIYVIRWIGPHNSYVDGEFIGVRLEGVERGQCPTYGHDDPPFNAKRFRPLVSDPLAIFRRIATDPDFKIDAPEGPVRDRPTREGAPRRKVKEEVE